MFHYRFFFFSSRRRHTICYRDWSSDVCSSDLVADGTKRPQPFAFAAGCLAKTGLAHPLLRQALEIDLAADNLGLDRKALRLGNQVAVLVNERVTIPGEVGGGLARTGPR